MSGRRVTNEVEQNRQVEEEPLLFSRVRQQSANCCGVRGSDIVHSEEGHSEEDYWTRSVDLEAALRLEHADPFTVADMGRLETPC